MLNNPYEINTITKMYTNSAKFQIKNDKLNYRTIQVTNEKMKKKLYEYKLTNLKPRL